MNKLQENKLREMIRQIIETELAEDLFPRESDSPYQKLFKQTLSKYGVTSPEELSPKLKEKFFNDIDNAWDAGENETDLDETTSSGAAGEYMTPKAFTKPGQDHSKSPAATAMKDWKTTKKIDESKNSVKEDIDFKDDIAPPKKRVAQSIRSVREQLHLIENLIDESLSIKEENKMGSNDLYVRTRKALGKIGEQINRISNKIQGIK